MHEGVGSEDRDPCPRDAELIVGLVLSVDGSHAGTPSRGIRLGEEFAVNDEFGCLRGAASDANMPSPRSGVGGEEVVADVPIMGGVIASSDDAGGLHLSVMIESTGSASAESDIPKHRPSFIKQQRVEVASRGSLDILATQRRTLNIRDPASPTSNLPSRCDLLLSKYVQHDLSPRGRARSHTQFLGLLAAMDEPAPDADPSPE